MQTELDPTETVKNAFIDGFANFWDMLPKWWILLAIAVVVLVTFGPGWIRSKSHRATQSTRSVLLLIAAITAIVLITIYA